MSAAPTTPLATSTVPRDLFGANSSIRTRDEVSAATTLAITSGKLRDLEAEIAADGTELDSLKDAITRSEHLTAKMTRLLHGFEGRMSELERVVMPVYRTILTMSQMNDRVEGTVALVEHLMRTNEQVRREVVLLLPGPTLDNLTVYLDAIVRLDGIVRELSVSDLAHCKISVERASVARNDAHGKIHRAFHDWLLQQSAPPPDPFALPPASVETVAPLATIARFFLPDVTQFGAVIATWVEVRSNFLASACEPFFLAAQNFDKQGASYVRGSHPLIRAMQVAFQLLQNEEMLMSQILPATVVGPTFFRSAQITRDLAVATVEAITARMKRAAARREYADQMCLLDVVEGAHAAILPPGRMTATAQSSLPLQALQPSVKFLSTAVASLFSDLIGEVRGTIPRALERPFAVPDNATVYELTSIVINTLRRMTDYGLVAEGMLAAQATSNWDGLLPASIHANPADHASTHPSTAVAQFCTTVLGALETSLDAKAKTLRRPMQTLLFQINNYNYIARSLRTAGDSVVGVFVDDAVIRRYDKIMEALIRSFLTSWSTIASLISESAHVVTTGSGDPGSARSTNAHASAKDRIKAFTVEFDDAVKTQSACSVPDLELRASLREKVTAAVIPPYIYFYNQNLALFTGSTGLMGKTGSKYHDPDQVEDAIAHLFEG